MTTPTKRRTRGRKRAGVKRASLTRALGRGALAAAAEGKAREAAQLTDALTRFRAARAEAAEKRQRRQASGPEREARVQALREKFNTEVDRLVEQRLQEPVMGEGRGPEAVCAVRGGCLQEPDTGV